MLVHVVVHWDRYELRDNRRMFGVGANGGAVNVSGVATIIEPCSPLSAASQRRESNNNSSPPSQQQQQQQHATRNGSVTETFNNEAMRSRSGTCSSLLSGRANFTKPHIRRYPDSAPVVSPKCPPYQNVGSSDTRFTTVNSESDMGGGVVTQADMDLLREQIVSSLRTDLRLLLSANHQDNMVTSSRPRGLRQYSRYDNNISIDDDDEDNHS